MAICFRCKKTKKVGVHHIDGAGTAIVEKDRNNKASNLIHLCTWCHDFVEAICSVCINRIFCNNLKFQKCWSYDEEKPIYFKETEENDE